MRLCTLHKLTVRLSDVATTTNPQMGSATAYTPSLPRAPRASANPARHCRCRIVGGGVVVAKAGGIDVGQSMNTVSWGWRRDIAHHRQWDGWEMGQPEVGDVAQYAT